MKKNRIRDKYKKKKRELVIYTYVKSELSTHFSNIYKRKNR